MRTSLTETNGRVTHLASRAAHLAPVGSAAGACVLAAPPQTGLLDRIARFFEGGDRGTPIDVLVDLADVVDGAPPEVAAFYRNPALYAITTGATGGPWSRFLMGVFAATFRQSCIPEQSGGFAAYPVCQHIYRDAQGRAHWDRYARVHGSLTRLFVARFDGSKGRVDETFVLWGIPVRLGFEAKVEGETLVLTLRPSYSSIFAWAAHVQYRTASEESGQGLRTQGDFRIPLFGLHVKTEFRMRR